MLTGKQCLKVLVVAAVLVWWSTALAPHAGASTYLGEFTWNVHETMTEDGPADRNYTMILGLSKISSTHFLVQGKILIPPSTLFQIISGGGVIVGDNLLLNLQSVQAPPDYPAGSHVYVQINKYTCNGTIYHVGPTFLTTSRTFDNSFGSGTLTVVPPLPVLTSSPSSLPLLLDE